MRILFELKFIILLGNDWFIDEQMAYSILLLFGLCFPLLHPRKKIVYFQSWSDSNDNQTHIVFNAFIHAWDDQKKYHEQSTDKVVRFSVGFSYDQ